MYNFLGHPWSRMFEGQMSKKKERHAEKTEAYFTDFWKSLKVDH